MQTVKDHQISSLNRAEQGQSLSNYPAIFSGFMSRGIPEDQIHPRVNVFTYNAWKAKGRQVRRGEKGVSIVSWITMSSKDDKTKTFKRPKKASVFHISQTDLA
mgnify:CR=1 FL=1